MPYTASMDDAARVRMAKMVVSFKVAAAAQGWLLRRVDLVPLPTESLPDALAAANARPA
eukprot:contig_47858_g10336